MSETMSIEEWRECAAEAAESALEAADDPSEFIRHEGFMADADSLVDAAKVLGVDDVCKIIDAAVDEMAATSDCFDKVIGRKRMKSFDDFLTRCGDTTKWLKDYVRLQMRDGEVSS